MARCDRAGRRRPSDLDAEGLGFGGDRESPPLTIDNWLTPPDDLDGPVPGPDLDPLGGEWQDRAACAGHWDVMFGDDPDAARAICATCPVAVPCLRFALDAEISDGVWAGLEWRQRVSLCPVCGETKGADDWLGCCFPHILLRVSRLIDLQASGEPDVRVSTRQRPSARTNPYCILPRGANHSSAASYKAGCRCDASLEALNEERRARGEHGTGRGRYGHRPAV